jgi:predicted AAA+ superfamily ATPase
MTYKRLLENKILSYLKISGGICVGGPRNCGKTTLCKTFCKSLIMLGESEQVRQRCMIDLKYLLNGENPRLIDEWQFLP